MMAVLSSGIIGSVTGSAMANVVITGSVTIPLMKRIGFEPHVAGAVEASASTGGQIMPPVMGAAAFLMMQFLGVPYLEVAKAALIPALLYFLGIMAAVYVYSHRAGLRGLPAHELPSLRAVLRHPVGGIAFLGGFGTLVSLLVMRYSPIMAVLYALLAVIVLSWPGRDRITPRKGLRVLSDSARDFTPLGAACACVGVIVSVVLLTGIGSRLTIVILNLSGGLLLVALPLTMLAAIILGTGLPTSISYLLLAIMLAPAIIDLGVPPMAAHLFIFYFGLLSMVTPPVALAAYAGASVAGANFWRTGLSACLLSAPAYIVPYAFVLSPALLMNGPAFLIIVETLTAGAGVCLIAVSLTGGLRHRKEVIERGLLFAAGVLFILPGYPSKLAAVALSLVGSWRFIRSALIRR